MEIDEKIIKETIHCRRNFECLKAENHILLNDKVKRCLEGKVHIVYCSEIFCSYKLTFGKYIICNCPVRKELYRIRKNA